MRWSASAAERLNKQGRSAGINKEASAATPPQAAPARDQAGLIGTANEQIIEPDQRGHVQALPRLGKRTIRDRAQQRFATAHRGEEAVEHGLLGWVACPLRILRRIRLRHR